MNMLSSIRATESLQYNTIIIIKMNNIVIYFFTNENQTTLKV